MTDGAAPPIRGHGLAFLELGERLRQRGQFDAAATVALSGLAHYPALADAHDLLGRIRADQGDQGAATSAWHAALEIHAGHTGALKGLAYVAFLARDLTTAERLLERAQREAPHDSSVIAALDRVRAARPTSPTDEPLTLDDRASGLLLADAQGMRLAGGTGAESSEAQADAAAAEATGLAREGARTARLLGLGAWRQLVLETPTMKLAVLPAGQDATLLVSRPATTPIGRLLATASRAARDAREWIERLP